MIDHIIDDDESSGEIVPHSKSACNLTAAIDNSDESTVDWKTTTCRGMSDSNSQPELSNASPSRTPARVPKSPASSRTKLRRNVSMEESIENAVSVQRLVEYFLVISCHPRWDDGKSSQIQKEDGNAVNSSGASATVASENPISQNNEEQITSTSNVCLQEEGKFQKKLDRFFEDRNNSYDRQKQHKKTGTDHALNHTLLDHPHEDEMREDPSLSSTATKTTIPPPKPQETWNRNEGLGENIRAPGANSESENYSSHAFAPKITARFPLQDHLDHPMNPMVTQFCFPEGDILYPSTDYIMPRAHHFVMTNDKGRKVYGTCLTIYEEYQPGENTPWQSSPEILYPTIVGENGIEVGLNPQGNCLYIPRCLCILSIWPYVAAFREYLAQLYRLATSTDCMKAPIERYVMNLCMEIPAPPPGSFEVKISILDSVIRFWSPPANLPIAYVALPYQILFDCLDIKNVIHLWYCLSMERKVLLVSSQKSILTVCSEILCSLLYPMKWSHLYVPVLPKFLCPILDAPVPYLCGVSRENWITVQKFVSDETIVVDLDRNSVMFGQRTLELPPAPAKTWLKLQRSLNDIAGHLFWRGRGLETEYKKFVKNEMSQDKFKKIAELKGEQVWKEKLMKLDQAFNLQYTPDSEHLINNENDDNEHNQWDRLQEAFLRFFVTMLKDYRQFLHVPDTSKLGSLAPTSEDWLNWGGNHIFDMDTFIASQKPEYFSYLTELCSTQQFDDFITKKMYNPKLPDIIFFDQSIDAKLNRSRLKLKKVHTPFLRSARTHKKLQPFVAVEPNTSDLPKAAPFIYETWPEKFKTSLFCEPRPIPTMITAEFDRQTSLTKRLQKNYSPCIKNNIDLANLYWSDYNYAPEGMSFTVFFFTYSSIIGREWQEYQLRRRDIECSAAHDERTKGGNGEENIDTQIDVRDRDVTFSSQSNSRRNNTPGVCDVVECRYVANVLDDCADYVTNGIPCPEINSGAQAAYNALSSFTLDHTNGCRNSSLLDDDEGFAEYEEAREVAIAQLDLAFDALYLMETRDLITDPDLFKSLMEACGRCGDTKRAIELIEIMKRKNLVADNDILSYLMASFSHCRTYDEEYISTENREGQRLNFDTYSPFLKKKMLKMRDSEGNVYDMDIPSDEDNSTSTSLSDCASELSNEYVSHPTLLQIFTPHMTKAKMKKKKFKRKKKVVENLTKNLSDRMKKQLIYGESLLEFLYPDIVIDTFGDTCPMCSNVMEENDIVSGWKKCGFQDFTTACPQCSHRFVPRFKVSCSSSTFEGSQGPGTPLYCEFLSPWVLRKELGHIVGNSEGIHQLLDPSWRSGNDVKATIW
eukprot:CAMPEP_0197181710 /NCGR_PEP_ID=MMETSP1423-20130617/5910_1 /TAXON_ID=476441 /ORGANISM="Pseudo-nitzschia heimii, Strain UNC1101" /LENGTH=1322 /DNA_ID=CAMNT_0042632007 /DNA_START=258 /DNA_END=4223 /DNA_ORIENTATION=+